MIEFKNVSFCYAGDQADSCLENINLSIKQGEVILLCGESGCGKTTLTRLINGLIPHYYEGELKGSVTVEGKAVTEIPLYETAKAVGSVFQNPRSQFFNVDATSELAFGCENRGMDKGEINHRIAKTVDEFHIEKLMGKSIFNLSGGEKQKIACASVSVSEPDIYVLDEPTSNLDVFAIEDLKQLISHWKSHGKTIVIAEHRLYFVHELTDRMIYMKNGRIAKEFSSEEMQMLSRMELEEMGLRPLSLKQLKNVKTNTSTLAEKISIKDMTFAYKHQLPFLSIECMSVPKGGAIAVIGHNGAGKSTFARCLCGLEKRCKGVVCYDHCNRKFRQRLKHSFMVMQDVNHQLFTESVLDEILLSMDEKNARDAETILKGLDLYELKDLHPMSLSGGQKQRVAIACAVASKRDLILFDEPTSGLDYRHMNEVSASLEQLRQLGKTLFVISHDPELILSSCTHVVHLENGTVSEQYPLDAAGKEKLMDFFVQMEQTRHCGKVETGIKNHCIQFIRM